MSYHMGGANPMKNEGRELTLNDIFCLLILLFFFVIPMFLILWFPVWLLGKIIYPFCPLFRAPKFTIGGVISGAIICSCIGHGIAVPEHAFLFIPLGIFVWMLCSIDDTNKDLKKGIVPPHIVKQIQRDEDEEQLRNIQAVMKEIDPEGGFWAWKQEDDRRKMEAARAAQGNS